jgi:hypothetical protein
MVAACQTTPAVTPRPTVVPFPTMTVGRTIRGELPVVDALPLDGANDLSNPATVIALANQPTVTPNYTACPAVVNSTLADKPSTARGLVDEISRYLSAGGRIDELERGLGNDWQILGDTGFVRADLDVTGEGIAEIILSYTATDDTGTLLIFGCVDGRYVPLYQALASSPNPPALLQAVDMNFDQLPDILFTNQFCDEDAKCTFQTQLIAWRPYQGRFLSLLANTITTDTLPEARDIDSDQVAEIVVRLRNPGDIASGPLRTGVNIYDWNGAVYTLSIVQLDPPRFTIQIIHEADRAFAQQDMAKAIPLYELALADTSLEDWYGDDGEILPSYILYRLLLAYAFVEDGRALDVHQQMIDAYPDPTFRPVFAQMTDVFWNALQVTNNLHSGCVEVGQIIRDRPDTLDLLNRYGDQSPTYSETALCPF